MPEPCTFQHKTAFCLCLNGGCSKQCPCITSILLCKYLFMQTLTPLFFICLPHQFHNHASPQPTATNTNVTDFIKVVQQIVYTNKPGVSIQIFNSNRGMAPKVPLAVLESDQNSGRLCHLRLNFRLQSMNSWNFQLSNLF